MWLITTFRPEHGCTHTSFSTTLLTVSPSYIQYFLLAFNSLKFTCLFGFDGDDVVQSKQYNVGFERVNHQVDLFSFLILHTHFSPIMQLSTIFATIAFIAVSCVSRAVPPRRVYTQVIPASTSLIRFHLFLRHRSSHSSCWGCDRSFLRSVASKKWT